MTAKSFATTPTIALFLILSVTGVFLLFHLAGPMVKILHEWLGLAFVLFALLHVLANWALMKRYLVGGKVALIVAMLVVATIFGLAPAPASDGGSPVRSLISQVKRAPLATVASLYGQEVTALIAQLQSQGYTVAGPESSLADLARRNGVAEEKILSLLAPPKK